MKRGDQFVAYWTELPRRRLFITVTRVAADGSWADQISQAYLDMAEATTTPQRKALEARIARLKAEEARA